MDFIIMFIFFLLYASAHLVFPLRDSVEKSSILRFTKSSLLNGHFSTLRDNYKAVTKVRDSQTAGNRVSDITYCDGYQP